MTGRGGDPFKPPGEGDEHAPLELDVSRAVRPVRPAAQLPPPDDAAAPVVDRIPQAPITIVNFLIALPVTFLPERWRKALRAESLPLPPATIVSGLAQAFVCAILFGLGIARQHELLGQEVGEAMWNVLKNTETQEETHGVPASGLVIFLSFVFTWKGVALIWLFFEGMIRAASAAIAGEVVGSAPFVLCDLLWRGAAAGVRRIRLGPLVPDRVTLAADKKTVRSIESCRPRDFGAATLDIDGAHYRVAAAEERPAGRFRWLYRLEPLPPNWPIRRMIRYRPDELLADSQHGWREFRTQWWSELKKLFSRRRQRS